MLVKIVKLTFYSFKNPSLFFYYAKTNTVTFRGIATPELARVLIEHLEVGEPFECKIVQRKDESYKLVELLEPANVKRFFPPDAEPEPQIILDSQMIKFVPKQISVFKRNGVLSAALKFDDDTYYGQPNRFWIMWFLTRLRKRDDVILQTRSNQFYMGAEAVTSDEFLERQESTYLDNKARFFFANESLDAVFKPASFH